MPAGDATGADPVIPGWDRVVRDPLNGRTPEEVFPALTAFYRRQAETVAQMLASPPVPRREAPHPWEEFNAHGNTCHHQGCVWTEEEHQRP